jgi:periplasmic copper chaperone A
VQQSTSSPKKGQFRVKPRYFLAAVAALALSACDKAPSEAPKAAESTAAAPDAKPGVAIAAARLVLPAVAGNPGAVYFMLDNRTAKEVRIAAIAIDGAAKVEMHQSTKGKMMPVDAVEVSAGTSVALEPGKLHAMVFTLDPKLKAGGNTEMTLTFADGDKVSVPLSIEAPGAAAHGDAH